MANLLPLKWKFRLFLSLCLTVLILWQLVKFVGSKELFAAFNVIKLKYALIALLLSLSFPFICALRWHFVLRATGQRIPILNCLILIMGAWPLNIFLPSRTGDFFKVAFVSKSNSKSMVFGSIVAEKILDVGCLALIGLLGAIAIKNKTFAIVFIGLLILVAILNQGLWLFKKLLKENKSPLLDKANLVIEGTNILSSCPKYAAIAASFSSINWFLSVVQALLFFKAFGINIPLIETAARLPLSIFIGVLPITLAGIGTRDAAMIFFFKSFAPAGIILGVAILYSLYSYFLYATLGIPFFIYLINRRKIN